MTLNDHKVGHASDKTVKILAEGETEILNKWPIQ